MSTYRVEKLPGEPIIYSWLSEDWSASELPTLVDTVTGILDAAEEPFIYISSTENISLNLQELISSTSILARGANTMLHHPNIREFVLVTKVKLIQLAARGLDSAAFGNLPVKLFETEDEAFAYARARIAER